MSPRGFAALLPAVVFHQLLGLLVLGSKLLNRDAISFEGAPAPQDGIVAKALDWVFQVGCGIALAGIGEARNSMSFKAALGLSDDAVTPAVAR